MKVFEDVIKEAKLQNAFDVEDYYKDVKASIQKARLQNAFDVENYYADVKEIIHNNLDTIFDKPYIRFKNSSSSNDDIFYDDIF